MLLAETNYFPIITGHKWTMNAHFESGKDIEQGHAYHEILEKEKIKGKEYYKQINTIIVKNKEISRLESYTRIDETGLYMLSGKDKVEYLDTPLPIKVGNNWKYTAYEDEFTVKVIKIGKVEVNGVTYENVAHLHKLNKKGNYKEDYWIAPDLSTIKSIITINDQTISLSFNKLDKLN